MLGWQDLRQAYRRSVVGPLWITAGMAVQVLTMGIVFGMIFKSELTEYLPFLSVSVVVWGLIASTLNEGCLSFISGEAIIKQLKLPLMTHVIRVAWKNLLMFGHNLIIIPIVLFAVGHTISWSAFLVIPGLMILILNLVWISLVLGVVSARYRDIPPIVTSILTIAFYVTPVMWFPSLIENSGVSHLLLGLNPFYHLLQIVRLPLLGSSPTLENWILAIVFALVGWLVTLQILKRYRAQIPYWV